LRDTPEIASAIYSLLQGALGQISLIPPPRGGCQLRSRARTSGGFYPGDVMVGEAEGRDRYSARQSLAKSRR